MDILKGYIADPYERLAFADFLKDAFGRHKNPHKICIWKTVGPSGTTTLEKLIFKAFEATGTKNSCRKCFYKFGMRNSPEIRLAFQDCYAYEIIFTPDFPVICHIQTAIPDEIALREDFLVVNLTPLDPANMRPGFAFDDAQVADFKRMLFED